MAERREKAIEVRAIVAHLEPGTHTYRSEGEKFSYAGKLYKHVELAGKQAGERLFLVAAGEAIGEAFDQR
jgi:hypothetical protein